MLNKEPTCGLEGKLPKHMKVKTDRNLCYDSRDCPYKLKIEYCGIDKTDICLYSNKSMNRNEK